MFEIEEWFQFKASEIYQHQVEEKKISAKKPSVPTQLSKLQTLAASDAKWKYPTLGNVIRAAGFPRNITLREFRKRGFIQEGSVLATEGALLDKFLTNRKRTQGTVACVTKTGFPFILYTLECIENSVYDDSSTVEPA